MGHTIGPSTEDIWVVRTTESGHREWSTVALRTATARVFDVVEDLSGDLLAPGWYRTSRTESDALFLRASGDDGRASWVTYEGGHRDAALSVVPVEPGNYVLLGYTQGTESGGVNGLLQVVRPDGTPVDRTADSVGAEVAVLSDGVRAPDGGCLAVGRRRRTTDADSEAFVAKYGPRGDRQWWHAVGPDRAAGAETVERHREGYVVGGNHHDASEGPRAWVVGIDGEGTEQWRTRIGGERARLNDTTTVGGDVLAGGLDPSEDESAWVGAIGPSGERRWIDTYGPRWLSSVASLTATADGGVVAGGNTLLDEDGQNGFLAKLFPSAQDPIPDVSVDPRSPVVGQRVTFDASGSTASRGEVVRYDWDLDGDGTADARGAVVEHAFGEPGDHEVTLRVVDDAGRAAVTTLTVNVGSGTPEPEAATDDGDTSVPGFGLGAAVAGVAGGLCYRLLRRRDE